MQREEIGSILLQRIKRGKPIEHLRVHMTHADLHRLFCGMTKHSIEIRKQYPLEVSFSRLGQEPEVIDCRQFTVPWDIALPKAPVPSPTRSDRPYVTDVAPSSARAESLL